MIRRFYNFEVRRETKLNLAHGGKIFIAAILALSLLFLGAKPSSLAQAAPANGTINFEMMAIPTERYVCVLKSLTIRVYVTRSIDSGSVGRFDIGRVYGVPIGASVVTPNMGKITPNILLAGFDIYSPAEVEFKYTAGKDPGTVFIKFNGRINSYWVGNGDIEHTNRPVNVDRTVQVEVRNCGYKIALPSSFSGPPGGGNCTGLLSCNSPYGPWDIRCELKSSQGLTYLKEYIPFSENGKTTALREEHFIGEVSGEDLAGLQYNVTITPNSKGYQINFPSSRVYGILWAIDSFGHKFNLYLEKTVEKLVFPIVPAESVECVP